MFLVEPLKSLSKNLLLRRLLLNVVEGLPVMCVHVNAKLGHPEKTLLIMIPLKKEVLFYKTLRITHVGLRTGVVSEKLGYSTLS